MEMAHCCLSEFLPAPKVLEVLGALQFSALGSGTKQKLQSFSQYSTVSIFLETNYIIPLNDNTFQNLVGITSSQIQKDST